MTVQFMQRLSRAVQVASPQERQQLVTGTAGVVQFADLSGPVRRLLLKLEARMGGG
jgi:hypothetical protein